MTPNKWNPKTTTVYSSRGSAKEIPLGEYDKFISSGWGASAPTTAPSVQTARPATEDVNKNIGTLDKTLEFYQKEGESAIYKSPEMKAGTEFETEAKATEAGVTPYWKPGFTGVSNVRQIKPTGDVVNDKRIAEVNQTISETPELFSTGYEPTLIEITEARPDVMDVARQQGGDPYTAGTPANTWLNDWYNRTGKAEGADMVRQGILGPKTETGTPAIDTTEVINAQDAVDEAIRTASEARDSEDYTAFKTAMEDLKTSRETLQTNLDTLYADQKKFREQYLESLKPTAIEEDLQSQLVNIRAEIDQTVLNAQAGINKVTGQAIPQGFVTGQSKAIADAANLTLQTQGVQEKNLIDRLEIEVGKKEYVTKALEAGLGFIGEDMDMQMQIQNRLDNQENTLVDRFERYEDKQKEDAGIILQALAGIDPNTLSPEALTKLAQISQQLGIGLPDILAGLQLQFDQVTFEKAKQAAELEPEDKVLSASQCATLGVPYGTTESQAAAMGITPARYKPTTPKAPKAPKPEEIVEWSEEAEAAGVVGWTQKKLDWVMNSPTAPPEFNQMMSEEHQMSKASWQEEWDEERNKILDAYRSNKDTSSDDYLDTLIKEALENK